MDRATFEIGLIQVFLQRFESQRLPRARVLEKKVGSGAVLDEFDLAFLEAALNDVHIFTRLLNHHPEYRNLVHQVLAYYRGILDRAEGNETMGGAP